MQFVGLFTRFTFFPFLNKDNVSASLLGFLMDLSTEEVEVRKQHMPATGQTNVLLRDLAISYLYQERYDSKSIPEEQTTCHLVASNLILTGHSR